MITIKNQERASLPFFKSFFSVNENKIESVTHLKSCGILFFASRQINTIAVNKKAERVATPVTKKSKIKGKQENKAPSPLGGENAIFSNFQIKRFADGTIPITYKEGQVNGKSSPNSIIHKIMERRARQQKTSAYQGLLAKVVEKSQAVKDKTYTGFSLIKLPAELPKNRWTSWAIYDGKSGKTFIPTASQIYIFVTMADNTIRVADSSFGHARLSDCASHIRYAGEVIFDNQQRIASWNNQSGGYCPSPYLAHQAGLGDGLARFEAKYDRNDEKQRHIAINESALRASR